MMGDRKERRDGYFRHLAGFFFCGPSFCRYTISNFNNRSQLKNQSPRRFPTLPSAEGSDPIKILVEPKKCPLQSIPSDFL